MENELPLKPGSTVNQYAIQYLLDRGPLGPVFQAYDTTAQRTVELRVVDGVLQDSNQQEGMRLIGERLVHLRHPHLLSVLNFGDQDGIFYLVTDSVRGTSLGERLQNDPPQGEAPLRILAELAATIDFLHQNDLVQGVLT
ncbi:MAG: hypothetical protein ACREP9_08805, partial [Candidatus Dormibacteraceae bacterium]